MIPDVRIPLREALAIVAEGDEADRALGPADLANLRRVVAGGDEQALVALVLAFRDSARARIREDLLARGREIAAIEAEAARRAAAWRLESRIREIVGLDAD